jgi:molybdopterin converting factor small subunit
MPNQVLFFGATAEITGAHAIEMDTLTGIEASDALTAITIKYPRLSFHKLHISINQEFAAADQTIADGDEIAIFTAVSGG